MDRLRAIATIQFGLTLPFTCDGPSHRPSDERRGPSDGSGSIRKMLCDPYSLQMDGVGSAVEQKGTPEDCEGTDEEIPEKLVDAARHRSISGSGSERRDWLIAL